LHKIIKSIEDEFRSFKPTVQNVQNQFSED